MLVAVLLVACLIACVSKSDFQDHDPFMRDLCWDTSGESSELTQPEAFSAYSSLTIEGEGNGIGIDAESNALGGILSYAGDFTTDGIDDVIVNDGDVFYAFEGPVASDVTVNRASRSAEVEGVSVWSGGGELTGNGGVDLVVGTATTAGAQVQLLNFDDGEIGLVASLKPDLVDEQLTPTSMAVGDIDGSGLDEVVVVFDGPYLQDATLLTVADASLELVAWGGDLAGEGIAADMGDLNGDGLDDVVLGQPNRDDGLVGIWSGAELPTLGEFSLDGAELVLLSPAPDYSVGASVSLADDMDGDGYSELLVGAPLAEDFGVVYIVRGGVAHGSMSLANADALIWGITEGGQAGDVVTGIGDANGDTLGDLVIADPTRQLFLDVDEDLEPIGLSMSEAYLVYGPISGVTSLCNADGALNVSEILKDTYSDDAGLGGSDTGVEYDEDWNYSVRMGLAPVGDVSDDGFDDFAVGSPDMATVFLVYGGFVRP